MTKKSLEMFNKLLDSVVERTDLVPDRVVILNLSKKKMAEIISPARLELIKYIKEKEPGSVNELSRNLKRPIESVSRDLRILANYGILEFVQVGKIKKPRIEKDMILVPLTA